MKLRLAASIRTRLLLSNALIILIGLAALTLFAGRQIERAIRADAEQQLKDQVRLLARSIGDQIQGADLDQATPEAIDALLKSYAGQVEGVLTLYLPNDPRTPESPPAERGRPNFPDLPELETAMNGETVVAHRPDAAGQDVLYTAARLEYRGQLIAGLLQLAVPAARLQAQVRSRRHGPQLPPAHDPGPGTALWSARSLTRPLLALRDAALRLSQGDLSYRIPHPGQDETGQVAHAFNQMAQEVQSMLEEQRAFARNTSHELRTPLTALRLRTEALRYDALDPETTRRYIEEIDDEIVHLGNLVGDVTLLSRFDAGRAELGQDEIDLGRLAAVLCAQLEPLARERQVEFTLDGCDQPLLVRAGLTHLTVVLRNLLDNALKYTPSGGKVSCTLSRTAGGVEIRVQDSGQGIAEEDLPHIFERFYRADPAHGREIPGIGLGLALVKSIVDAYGGQIRVASAGVGYGTTVTLLWPVA
ncbi:MAG: HAMP domain-containing histidine kinase [Caldilineales bacterium]|nr:HAMP domain-containing histidine kinase [Caldilineales bacterium]